MASNPSGAINVTSKYFKYGATAAAGALVVKKGIDFISKFDTSHNANEDYGTQKATGYAPENSYYQMIISQIGNNEKTVVANAPLELDLTIQNNFVDFSTLFESTPAFGEAVSSRYASAAGFVSSTTGAYNQARVASFQIWGGTTPMQFPVQLTFKAHTDPMKDVINPVRNLLWMASPSGQNSFLNSPGPSIADGLKALIGKGNFFTSLDKSIMVRQGRFLLPGLVIESLQLRISPRAERKSGLPMAIDVMITFKTVVSYSREEIFAAFYGSNFNVNGLSSPQSRQQAQP